eukprot:TRINITY_DN65015_c0_g1_i1.p1 TRINITY_DN65015_c0_g1~~TRINITY_DN65015_c0_g1_i1.p1  ORF type:complete len:544 (+),score=87.58 TRINITY_DN65015_c0_g1_i1:69-1700(+)
MEREEEEEEPSLLESYLNLPIPEDALVAAFGTREAVQEAISDVGSLLQSIEEAEPDHLSSSILNFQQFFRYLTLRPTLESGAALRQYVIAIRQSMDERAAWPKEPLPDERLGTVLEGVDHIIFDSETEGLIRLQWVNPLPMLTFLQSGGYRCDVCMSSDLKLGYQRITEDDTRDNTSLMDRRTGFDACTACAVNHLKCHRERISAWFQQRDAPECLALRSLPSPQKPPELILQVTKEEDTKGLIVTVDVQGTSGLHVAVALLSGGSSQLPSEWCSSGRKLGSDVAPSLTHTMSQDGDVEFPCAQSCDVFRIAAGEKNQLLCAKRPAGDEVWGEALPLKSLLVSERPVEERSADKPMAFIAFAGTGMTAWLPEADRSRILGELHCLASKAGVAHNIPRVQPLGAVSSMSVAATDSSETARGLSFGFFRSQDWADITCAICLDSLDTQNWVRGTPLRTGCGHLFHGLCLRTHLKGKGSSCPNCRASDPLSNAEGVGNAKLSWRFAEDIDGRFVDPNESYRVIACLCQDPEAALDSALMFAMALVP